MSNIRVRFIRGEEVKYISHLDLMQVFERAMRRAMIPIAYSMGFNPHPHMVFGLPLSVGVTSEAEYGEFELAEEMPPEVFVEKLNDSLPKGIKIMAAKEKHSKTNIMASVSAASYEVTLLLMKKAEEKEVDELVARFLSQDVIMVKKEGKSGIKDVDIKSMIHKMDASVIKGEGLGKNVTDLIETDSQTSIRFSILLSAGSVANLKPELLISAFEAASGIKIKILKIHRTRLYVSKEGKLVDPLDDSVL